MLETPEYVSVLVDVGARRTDREFHYRVPPHLTGRVRPGHRVRIPFGPRRVTGLVLAHVASPGVDEVRDLCDLLDDEPILTPPMVSLAEWVAARYLGLRARAMRLLLPAGLRRGAPLPAGPEVLEVAAGRDAALDQLGSRAPAQRRALRCLLESGQGVTRAELARRAGVSPGAIRALLDRGLVTVRPSRPGPTVEPTSGGGDAAPALTPEQGQVVPVLLGDMESQSPGSWLLHGVTGSGKTEVYLRVVEHALSRGRGSIVLVPEIGLTPQTVRWFRGRLGARVAVLHSALSDGDRYREWERVRGGQAQVVVGARSAVFAPVPRLGAVIVDEEHDRSYKQDETPHYHAREVARERARREHALLVLGSATPSVETYHGATSGQTGYLRLAGRVGGRPLPRPQLVDMRDELAAGNRSMFSLPLREALLSAIAAGEQAVLFINRRGYASFLLCRACGLVLKCPHCAVSVTLHMSSRRLVCHYCDHTAPVPDTCPGCGSPHIKAFGAGTERVAAVVSSLVPGARVLRMDTDTTRRRGAHERIYTAFRRGQADILVGTQMVAKGWDIPSVTVVGVMSADIGLHLPDFRTAERTFQILTQVAGRAGRGEGRASVIVQTYNPDHPAVVAAARGDQDGFYRGELETRRQLGLPPFCALARVLVRGPDREAVSATAGALARAARASGAPVQLMGPAPAPFERLRGNYRWHVAIKGGSRDDLMACLRALPLGAGERAGAHVTVDVDPESML